MTDTLTPARPDSLGPKQLEHCRQWPAFRDMERTTERLRKEWVQSFLSVRWPIGKDPMAREDREAA